MSNLSTGGPGAPEIHQVPARPYASQLTLIPPLADPAHDVTGVEPIEFWVYGGQDTVDRARQWALGHRYLLADGIDACAHGLYMLSCPGNVCLNGDFGFDHTRIWVPADTAQERPFILTQPYVNEVPGRLRVYAEAHGLELSAGMFGDEQLHEEWDGWDNWYSPGRALPIRLTIPGNWPMWPVEEQAVLLLHTQPVRWPEEDGA